MGKITVIEGDPNAYVEGLKVATKNLSSISGVFDLTYQNQTKSIVIYMHDYKEIAFGNTVFQLYLSNPKVMKSYDGRIVHTAELQVFKFENKPDNPQVLSNTTANNIMSNIKDSGLTAILLIILIILSLIGLVKK